MSIPFTMKSTTMRKELDKIDEKVYSCIQAPRSFFAVVMRRLHQKLKGYLKSVPFLFSTTFLAIRQKEYVMKTFLNVRHLVTTITLAIAVTLAACGGGSTGGSIQQPTAVDASISVESVLPVNSSTGVARDATLSVTYSVPTGTFTSAAATLTCDTIAVSLTVNPTATGATFSHTPLEGNSCTLKLVGNASGTNGGKSASVASEVSFTLAAPQKLVYSNVHVAVRYGRAGIFNDAGYVEAVNQTTYTTTNLTKIDGTYIAEEPLADGRFLELSRMTKDYKFYVVAHDPITNTIRDYNGPLPAGYEFENDTNGGLSRVGNKWHRCNRFCGNDWGTPPADYMGSWATDGANGWFYVNTKDQRELHHLHSNGSDTVAYPIQSDNGSFLVMTTISNH
jgi:hypothetical protein